MARHSVRLSPTVSLICASALWAIATVISKKLLTSVPPITLLVFQLLPSVLVLWLLTILKGGPRPSWRSLAPLALIGLLNPGLAYTRSPDPAHRRGAVVGSSPAARSPQRADQHPTPPITLAGSAVNVADETKHFKLIGTTGTGKSTAIREMLTAALARGDRVIIADPDGGYLDSFYSAERGDVILNPFEIGAAKWNLVDEIERDYDVDQLARCLIPDNGDPDRVWTEYARTFFAAIVQRNIATGVRDDGEIYRQLTTGSVEELKMVLAGTPAGPFLADGNDGMFGSVRSVTSSAVRALKYTTRQQGVPFSVRKWVKEGAALHSGGRGGALFMPYTAGEIATLRSTISAWMRIAIFEAMNREEGDQRLWFVVDELDALGEIDGLKDALARLRKFGGRCVLGFQSIAQVSNTYGKGAADAIVENCGNTLILRCSASEHGGTSEFASRLIGQREVTHTTQSISRRPGEWRRSTTLSEQVNIEPAVMASEIERLPDLEGFLKFASIPDWQRVTLAPINAPSRPRTRPSPTPSHVVPPQAPPILATSSEDSFSSAEPTPSKTAKPAKSTRKRASTRKPRPRPPAIDSAPTSP
jgi:Type IV secretion-system coupling protein DNA-binding domain/EamA-like transporter family